MSRESLKGGLSRELHFSNLGDYYRETLNSHLHPRHQSRITIFEARNACFRGRVTVSLIPCKISVSRVKPSLVIYTEDSKFPPGLVSRLKPNHMWPEGKLIETKISKTSIEWKPSEMLCYFQ